MSLRKDKPISWGTRVIRDVALGLGIIAAAVLLFLLRLYTGKAISASWLGLACSTIIIFLYSAREYRRYWHRTTFWLVLTGLLAVHVLAFVTILRQYPEWRLLWFVPTSLVEGWIVILVLHSMLHGSRNDHRNHLPQSGA